MKKKMTKKSLYLTSILGNILLDIIVAFPTYKLFWSPYWIFSLPMPIMVSLAFNLAYMTPERKKIAGREMFKLRFAGFIIVNTILTYALVALFTIAMIKITGKSR